MRSVPAAAKVLSQAFPFRGGMSLEQHLRHLPIPVLIFQTGSVVYSNAEIRTRFRFGNDEILLNSAILLELVAQYLGLASLARSEEKGSAAESHHCVHLQASRNDGSLFPCEVTGFRVDWNAQPAQLLCIRDLTVEQYALSKVRNLSAGSIAGILVHRDMRPLFVNDTYAQMYGYESKEQILQMESVLQLTDPEDRETVWGYYVKRMKGEPVPSRYIHRSRTRDGKQIFIDNRVTVVNWDGQLAVQVTNMDVTEYVVAQTMSQGDRLSMLGQIAAGMAKRFTEHTSQLSSEVTVAKTHAYLEGNGQVLERLLAIESIVRVFRTDLDDLLVTAKDGAAVEHAINLKELIAQVVSERLRPDDVRVIRSAAIRLELEHGEEPPSIVGDPFHVRRVLHAVLDNGVEAMPHGGEISINMRATAIRRGTSTVPKGRYVVIEVSDEGGGIDPSVLDRLGEPFLSTKAGHAGMGIATCVALMRRHHGYVTFQRNKPRGTRVCLYFPLIREVAYPSS